jgi:deoxyribodipyrimidine photo-lyase
VSQPQVAIWWIRRDLRLADNPALAAALARAGVVIPLFILDPHLLNAPGQRAAHKRLDFLFGGLRQLDDDLRRCGSWLIVRRGEPLAVLTRLRDQASAVAIVAAEDFSPYARQRDAAVAACLPLELTPGTVVHHPAALVKADGQPYTLFTPFSRSWKARAIPTPRDLLAAPARLAPLPYVASEPLPQPSDSRPLYFIPGERCAREALERFVQSGLDRYGLLRNRLDGDFTSALSPYLRFGMLSPREAAAAAQAANVAAPDAEARRGGEAWLNEIIWREFFIAMLYHLPRVLRQPFELLPGGPPSAQDAAREAAWRQGLTGYPVVDAAMRQLAETGWMHNRARMIVASFLVKDLLVGWRRGEAWFRQHLVDADPAVNIGNWRWVAGVGAGAAPFFRVFNPTRQAQAHDPQGDFARAWLPELRRVPDAYIHVPWTMPEELERQARCRIGVDYPAPIIDHALARQRALAAWRAQRLAR